MLSIIKSAAVHGIDAYLINVEVDIASGLPTFSIVGLPDASVKESKDRVVAAVRNSRFDFPTKRITVNLAPADIKKEGASFDLPIAIGILTASEVIEKKGIEDYYFIGELALDGTLRPVKGILPIVLGMQKHGLKKIILPMINADEASIVRGIEIFAVSNLQEVVKFFNGELNIQPYKHTSYNVYAQSEEYDVDFSEVKGQQFAKRALEVAASGGHNIIMIGPPGSGKTMLAKRFSTILPPMTFEEALETTKINSVAGVLLPGKKLLTQRPFRSPHHTVSNIALIGGGSYPKPGEVSLAHNGVLFLDEMTEFHRDVLEVLRQPMEDHEVTISRAKSSLIFPAHFMLLGAMNPCPCGNLGNADKQCMCNEYQIKRYRSRISEPLLDRIDIHLEIPPLKVSDLTGETNTSDESSLSIRNRVIKSREIQKNRFKGTKIYSNSQMNSRLLKKFCIVTDEGKSLLRNAIGKLGLSGRAYDRILKVSRTIADLEASEEIQKVHIAEAIQYRNLDRQ